MHWPPAGYPQLLRMTRDEACSWMARVLIDPPEEEHIARLDLKELIKTMHSIEALMRLYSETSIRRASAGQYATIYTSPAREQ